MGRVADVVPLVPAWRVDRAFSYEMPAGVEAEVGSLVRVPFGGRNVRAVVVSVEQASSEDLLAVLGVVGPAPVAPAPMPQVLEWIAKRYAAPRGVAYDRSVPPRVRVAPRPESAPEIAGRSLLGDLEGGRELLNEVSGAGNGLWLLRMTPDIRPAEVIAELASRASGQVLALVPEVRWGSPVIAELEGLAPRTARLDSTVDDMQRSESWFSMALGNKLGIGGRGAVLAPAPGLRVLVLDDEPNPAYKEDRSPRFDARRVAIERARAQGAVCVLMGVAHSVESAWLARMGRARWVSPSSARLKSMRPNVELAEPPDNGLSRELHRAVSQTLKSGGKVGLLASQRGYASALWCTDCRRSVRCPRCEAGVVYERAARAARCPRCSFSGRAPDVCPTCGSTEFAFLGAGSERLAEQLGAMFPRARVRRVDPEVLARSETPPDLDDADIYLTTWVGTKPSLRPEVDLVGVLDADTLIRRPEMRAAESAYLALAEMAAWAGPSSEGGRLVIQTREPGHHSVQAVVRADHDHFLDRELPTREDLGYPPFSELIRVRAWGAQAERLLAASAAAAEDSGAAVLGPIDVVVGASEQKELLLKCPDAGIVAEALRVILPDVPQGTWVRIDVDPR